MTDSKEEQEEVVVYWSPHSNMNRRHQQDLLDIAPRSLMSDLQKRRAIDPKMPPASHVRQNTHPGNYHMCAALHTLAKNTFIARAPFSADISLDEQGTILENQMYNGWFSERVTSLEGAFAVDFDVAYLFFSEEPLEITVTPPYMHKTKQAEQGFVSSVAFDISSWLRPVVLIYQLFEGVNKITIEEDDPIAYLTFNTKKKVVFKAFKHTADIEDQVQACLGYKHIKPYEKMEDLYEQFRKTGMHERVLKEIKANLI